MDIIPDSEKKRLQSLKEKKQAFKAKEQVVRQALSNLDNTKQKKIIFDDETDAQQSTKLNTKKRKNKELFDSDSDDDNKNDEDGNGNLWNEEDFNSNKSKKAILGNDARFTLDDRFIENDQQNETTEAVKDTDQCDFQKEKEKQLDILQSILGTPLATKEPSTKTAKKGLMIRYDPTENGHCEYEVKLELQKESKEKKSKKKKQDKRVLEIEEPASVEVSKDIYYNVSDTLAESLKQKGEFSLLKIHGKEKDNAENNKNNDAYTSRNNEAQAFRFKFDANDAFKCDTSNDKDIDNVPDADEQMIDETKNNTDANNIFVYRNTLFFDDQDARFNEAVKFFNTEATSNNEFKNLRRELKMIVRTKIRKNEKRNQPWGNKRKVKRVVKSVKRSNKHF